MSGPDALAPEVPDMPAPTPEAQALPPAVVDGIAVRACTARSESHIIIIRDEKPSSFITESNITIESYDGKVINGFGNPDSDEVSVSVFKDDEIVKLHSRAKKKLSEVKLGSKYKFSVEDDNVLCIANWKMKVLKIQMRL